MVLPLVAAGALAIPAVRKWAGKTIGGAVDDFKNVGKNDFQSDPYQFDWGYANDARDDAAQQETQAGMGGTWAQNQMMEDRGPQAQESAYYADREATARDYDQAGALQLSREAAMGMAPSEAAYQLQAGLNQASQQQAQIAGGARGSAALALAQQNAAGQVGNLQGQAFTEAGRLRAQEMAAARQQYMQGAENMRAQDQQRMAQTNQMGQYNAGANDQYSLGMGNLANQFGNQQLGARGQEIGVAMGQQEAQAREHGRSEALNAGVSQANSDNEKDRNNALWGMGATAVQGIGGMAGGGK